MSCISDSLCLFHTSVYYGYVTFPRNLRDGKSIKVSRTLLSILTNAVVQKVSLRSSISNSSSSLPKLLGTDPSSLVTIIISFRLHSIIFLVFGQGLHICLPFRFLRFSFYCSQRRLSPLYAMFAFYHLVWSSVSQNPRKFNVTLSAGRILVLHISFGSMDKFQFFA